MDLGTLCQLMHLPPEASPDLVLLRTTLAAQQWAKERKLDLSIKPLTLASLNLGDGCKYPELDSQIKAARTRVLFEFTTILAILFRATAKLDFCLNASMKTGYTRFIERNCTYTNADIFPLHCWNPQCKALDQWQLRKLVLDAVTCKEICQTCF